MICLKMGLNHSLIYLSCLDLLNKDEQSCFWILIDFTLCIIKNVILYEFIDAH